MLFLNFYKIWCWLFMCQFLEFEAYFFDFHFNEECFVNLEYGLLRGEFRTTPIKKVNFCAYKGIPYAKPPVGNLRFKDPVLAPIPWSGVRDATKHRLPCVQVDVLYNTAGLNESSEDCLYLNVYAPSILSRKNYFKPVMVWIHGGGFLFGSGNEELYGPDFLLDHDVILVTFNYRLGVFGFLNLESNEAPGNMGLKDQNAVLQWVNSYIHLFGGDPNQVTLFGESSGSVSVHAHILSDISNGLFQYAIMQSGSILVPWGFYNDTVNEGFLLGEKLNCQLDSKNNKSSLITCLKKASVADLRTKQIELLDLEKMRKGLNFTFLPSVEKEGTGTRNFFVKDPREIFFEGEYKRIPTIFGYNNIEGFIFFVVQNINSSEIIDMIFADPRGLVPYSLGIDGDQKLFVEVLDKVKKFFFNDLPPSWDRNFGDIVNIVGDIEILVPLLQTIQNMIKYSRNTPIYLYEFAVDGNRNTVKQRGRQISPKYNELKGASHLDECSYLFNISVLGNVPVDLKSIEGKTIIEMTTTWTNFAINGYPNGRGISGWKSLTENSNSCIYIDNKGQKLQNICEPNRSKFWNDIFREYQRKIY